MSVKTKDAEPLFEKHAPQADVILRSSDNVDFRAHKSTLSIASPVFATVFSITQPPIPSISPSIDANEQKDGLPVVSLSEDSETLDLLLRSFYPGFTTERIKIEMVSSTGDAELAGIIRLLEASEKCDTRAAHTVTSFSLDQAWRRHPSGQRLMVQLYAIARRFNLSHIADTMKTGLTARGCTSRSLLSCDVHEIRLITGTEYRELVFSCSRS